VFSLRLSWRTLLISRILRRTPAKISPTSGALTSTFHSRPSAAKSKRSQKQCLKWAMKDKITCHMHGGKSRGPITTKGKARSRQVALRHGQYTKEALALYTEITTLIRQAKSFLHSLVQE